MGFYFWCLVVLGGMPLLIYPLLVLAVVFASCVPSTAGPMPVPLLAFLILSLAYPVVYIGCNLFAFVHYSERGYHTAAKCAIWPLLYLLVVAVFYLLSASDPWPRDNTFRSPFENQGGLANDRMYRSPI